MKRSGLLLTLIILLFLLGCGAVARLGGTRIHHKKEETAGIGDFNFVLTDTFISNQGQFPSPVKFAALGNDYVIAAMRAALTFVQQEDTKGVVVQLNFGNNCDEPIGEEASEGLANFIKGSKPENWILGAQRFKALRYKQPWPGVDVLVKLDQGNLKYELLVEPGADINGIELSVEGVDKLELSEDGTLKAITQLGEWTNELPIAYQNGARGRQDVTIQYVVNSAGRFGFKSGQYDSGRALIIDPGITFRRSFGGGSTDIAEAIAVDRLGNVYLTGTTGSPDFPTTPGSFDSSGPPSLGPFGTSGFVSKFQRSRRLPPLILRFFWWFFFGTPFGEPGYELAYSTYLYNGELVYPIAIEVDSLGSAYITGMVIDEGSTFPTGCTVPTACTPLDPSYNGEEDAFVTKLTPSGGGLAYSTFLGGSEPDRALDIAIDNDGFAYVAGHTKSSGFPTTEGALSTSPWPVDFSEVGDAFVSKISMNGTSLIFSTFLGGSGMDKATGIAVDSWNQVHVVGTTGSSGSTVGSIPFRATSGAIAETFKGGRTDAFVATVNPMGSALLYSTYLGGLGRDRATSISVHNTHPQRRLPTIYVVGLTESDDFPITPSAFSTFRGNGVFVTRMLPEAGEGLVYSTFLDASGSVPPDIDVDEREIAHVVAASSLISVLPRGSLLAHRIFISEGNSSAIHVDPGGRVAYIAGKIDTGRTVWDGRTPYSDADAFWLKLDIR